jgi:hypothetical protein
MVIKKFLLFILTVSIFTISGNALERKKPLPLRELQNPKGPSYVPIPYPKNDKEVIIDLKYYFAKELEPKKNKYSVGDFDASDKIKRDFLEGKDVFVGEILRIKNELSAWERDYTFLIRLKTGNNIWVANICMNSNGLWCGQSAIDREKIKLPNFNNSYAFMPYGNKKPIVKQIRDILGYEMNANEKENMQLVDGQCEIADMLFPAWEIKLADKRIIYKNLQKNIFYQVEQKLGIESVDFKNEFLKTYSNDRYKRFSKTLTGDVLVLKEIWRENENN